MHGLVALAEYQVTLIGRKCGLFYCQISLLITFIKVKFVQSEPYTIKKIFKKSFLVHKDTLLLNEKIIPILIILTLLEKYTSVSSGDRDAKSVRSFIFCLKAKRNFLKPNAAHVLW